MSRPRVLTYWCHTCGLGRNFGDQLGPVLLRHFGIEAEWASPRAAELVTVGSVLTKMPNAWAGTILGTGFIRPVGRRSIPAARVLAVRGALTRDALGLSRTATVLGDPGILVPDLIGGVRPRKPDAPMAIAPHYVDHAMVDRHPEARFLDVRSRPTLFLARLATAGVLHTSSLHALIAADALGVPHVLEPHGDVIGGLHKFTDYASAFGDRIVPGVVRLTDRGAMAERQAALRAAFLELAARPHR